MPKRLDTPEKIEANRQYQAKWYKDNKAIQYRRVKERIKFLQKWLRDYKSSLSCERCDENHIATLDFHHTDPKTKEASVSELSKKGWGVRRILAEIEKCEVLCANCHRKQHYVGE